MSTYQTKEFARFARKARIRHAQLSEAARAVGAGQWDADLGGGVFKQRVARDGGGKSGGFRTIILFKLGGHSFFVHGFAKSAMANVTPRELKALKTLGDVLHSLDANALAEAGAAGEILELEDDV